MKPRSGDRLISRAQLGGVLAMSLFCVGEISARAQGDTLPASPNEVLKAYRQMDAKGERLTASGWYRASKFFVKPARPPQHKVLAVMDDEMVDATVLTKGNRAEIQVLCSAVGQVDSLGRFTFVVLPNLIDSSGRPVILPATEAMRGPNAPLTRVYDLVRTDTQWEFGPKGDGPHMVKGTPKWRIETFEFEPWVTIEVAIRYLGELRERSTSEVVRNNAEKSIVILRGMLDH